MIAVANENYFESEVKPQYKQEIKNKLLYCHRLIQVHIENLRLFAHGHQPMVGLGVFLKNRVQKLDLDPTRENTFTSEVEREFQVTTPPGEGSLEMEVRSSKNLGLNVYTFQQKILIIFSHTASSKLSLSCYT